MYFLGCRFFRERPGQHELGLENRAAGFDSAVQGSTHPSDRWMPDPALDVRDGVTCIHLIPASVQFLSGSAELDEKVARQVLRFDLPAFFAPKP
jgi:hypothetical protein